jgi:hypothetical protein
MSDVAALVSHVRSAFSGGRYPGDAFLVGSRDGCEPYDVVSNFFGREEWWTLEPQFLDAHHEALSFFSEAGFRFFLPAYLIADLHDRLYTADPTFHLTHGFRMSEFDYPGVTRTFVRRTGGEALLNPRRYGAMTWQDYARFRLSVFSREECAAIVEYLRYKRVREPDSVQTPAIDASLSLFWLARLTAAPAAADLVAHLHEEHEFNADIVKKFEQREKSQ